jgi:D-alanyl-D-alanine carboxypeptidase|tara:strand:+ start:69520 stop:70515 length:996 start_codon:yes stop_codon:yes gene_type:complete
MNEIHNNNDETVAPEDGMQTQKSTTHKLIGGVVVVLGLIGIFILADWIGIKSPQIASETPKDTSVPFVNPFSDLSLEAKAAYVFDVREQKVLFAHNEEVQLPLASLTKLMAALVVHTSLDQKTIVSIDAHAIAKEGDSGFSIGEKWLVTDLIDFALIESSNDAINALASVASFKLVGTDDPRLQENAFIQEMNRTANNVGLTQTYFVNETGLDNGVYLSGGYGSARDMAQLFEYILLEAPNVVAATRYSELDIRSFSSVYTAHNTNNSIGSIPGLIASKTGFTDLAGGNLIIAFDAGIGHPIIVSVLGATRESRFTDVHKLADSAFSYINR